MAEAQRTYAFGRNFYVAQFNETNMHISTGTRYYNFPQSHDTMSSRQATFAFIASVLLNFLQLKYQAKALSPFETHPKITLLAITSFLIYCLSHDIKLIISANRRASYYALVVHCSMSFFGPLALASLSAIIFPSSLCYLIYSLSALYSLCQLSSSSVKRIWNWLRALIRENFPPQPPAHRMCQQEESRRGSLVSVHLPWLPEDDQVDMMPV